MGLRRGRGGRRDRRTGLSMEHLDSTTMKALLGFLSRRQDEILDSICRLVEIESPSGDLDASRAIVNLLVEAAETISAIDSIERVSVPGYGEHLRIQAFGGNDDQTTLLIGHTDTVHPIGSLKSQRLYVEGDRLYGPGVFDMKASCILAFEALRALEFLGLYPGRTVILLLTCDEESGSYYGRKLVEAEAQRAAHALVLEPPAPGGRVKTARKGVGIWKVRAHGIAAHAGLNPDAGASAVLELARQTERFHSMSANGTTFNVGVLRGGTRCNVVAAEAEMELDARFASITEAHKVCDMMNTLRAIDPRIRLTVEGGINRNPVERTLDVAKLYTHARGLAASIGFELGEESVGGASDGNFVAAFNVPVLDGLGPDGDGAHSANEYILISDLARRAALLAGLIVSL